jgi:hypothetical protein
VVWARQAGAREDSAFESSESFESFEPQAEEPTSVAPVRVRVRPMVESSSQPEPEPEREHDLEPELSRIAAVPSPPREPEWEPEPVPTRVVAFIPANEGPREWNLWELERAARDHATDDVVRNEERSYLLMYLREFAGPDGILPADFDGLVRDAFGDMLHTVGA